MSNYPKHIVVDTTFLDAMYRLGIFDHIVLLYSKVFIPVEVEREFLSEKNCDHDARFDYLINKFDTSSWLYKCNSYDQGIIDILQTDSRMHRGESEVLAQTKQLGLTELPESSLCAVLDDKAARKKAEYMNIQRIGTLKVLAIFHHSYKNINYFDSVNKLRGQGVKYAEKVIIETYRTVEEEVKGGKVLFVDMTKVVK